MPRDGTVTRPPARRPGPDGVQVGAHAPGRPGPGPGPTVPAALELSVHVTRPGHRLKPESLAVIARESPSHGSRHSAPGLGRGSSGTSTDSEPSGGCNPRASRFQKPIENDAYSGK